MKFSNTQLPGVILVEPKVHKDTRGFFLETYHSRQYKSHGIFPDFVQDNHSRSQYGTLRGLHSQCQFPQGKLVRVIEGEIFDVAVDIRKGSPTYGQWEGFRLSAENFRQLYIPPEFAHGFCVLSEIAQVEYKCTDFYAPDDELSVRWDDPELAIVWPLDEPLLSTRDAEAPLLSEVQHRLPTYSP